MLRIELNDSQKIVLFELLNKLELNADLDVADRKLVDDLIATLEKELVEPFSPDYKRILQAAKDDILKS